MNQAEAVAAAERLEQELRDEARDLIHAAAGWREAAGMTRGNAARQLTWDALANEAQAAKLEQRAAQVAVIRAALEQSQAVLKECALDAEKIATDPSVPASQRRWLMKLLAERLAVAVQATPPPPARKE